ncbi:MAG: TRAP transporter substrate-binding protein DctP [Gammaproteobacteria bacterium]|nr:TRAP transporter substrate-binding protein DctP [Gammaproteobacteria bacterium]
MQLLKTTIFSLLLGFALGAPAAYAVDIKIATLAPNQSAWMQDMRAAGKEIEQRTDGRVKLKFYGGGTQGSEDKVLQKIKIGQLHGGTFSATDFMKDYGAINIYGLPFVFESWEEMRYVRDRMDDKLQAGFTDLNYVTFGIAGSFSMVLSNEPIRNYEDMKGKKVWLPQGDFVSYEAMRRLQLSPVALPITDVLTGLQTGLLDIAAIPPEVAVALQWHTRVKYVTNMPVAFGIAFLAISKRTFDRLSDTDQAVVSEVLRSVYANIDKNAPAESENAMRALQSIGITHVEPEEGQFAELQQTMGEFNREMAVDGAYPLEVYEEMLGHIAEYRNGNSTANSSGN